MRRRRYRRPADQNEDTQPRQSDADGWTQPALEPRKPPPDANKDLDALFAPLPDERGGYAAPRDNSRGPMILVLAIGVLLVFGVVLYNAYKQGVRHGDRSALPEIASEGSFKSTPDDPGGRASVNVDKQVLGQVEGRSEDEDITPAVVREEPVPVENAAMDAGLESKTPAKDPFADPFASSDRFKSAPTATPTSDGRPMDLRNQFKTKSDAETSPTPQPTRQVAEATTPRVDPFAQPPKPKPTVARPKPAPTTPMTSTMSTTASGKFVVQLASVRTADAVDAEWTKASTRAPSLMGRAQKVVTTVDLGDKGVWHRVRAGHFDSRPAAEAFCNAYKASGGDCFVTAR